MSVHLDRIIHGWTGLEPTDWENRKLVGLAHPHARRFLCYRRTVCIIVAFVQSIWLLATCLSSYSLPISTIYVVSYTLQTGLLGSSMYYWNDYSRSAPLMLWSFIMGLSGGVIVLYLPYGLIEDSDNYVSLGWNLGIQVLTLIGTLILNLQRLSQLYPEFYISLGLVSIMTIPITIIGFGMIIHMFELINLGTTGLAVSPYVLGLLVVIALVIIGGLVRYYNWGLVYPGLVFIGLSINIGVLIWTSLDQHPGVVVSKVISLCLSMIYALYSDVVSFDLIVKLYELKYTCDANREWCPLVDPEFIEYLLGTQSVDV